MKSRLDVLVLALALMPPAVTQAQTTNPPYLAQFPSAEQIKSVVKGADAMETAAKQAGVFWQFYQLISNLAYSEHRMDRQFTPDEKRMVGEYYAAYGTAIQLFEGRVTGADKPKWFELHTKYELDRFLRDEVFKKFFTPQLRSAVFIALKEQMPTYTPLESTLTGAARLPTPAAAEPVGNNSPAQPSASASGKQSAQQQSPVYSSPAATQASSSNIASSTALFKEGEAYFKAKDYEKALERFNRSIEVGPSSAGYIFKGITLFNLKRYAEAVSPLQQTIKMVPANPEAHFWLGKAFLMQGNSALAELELREGLRLKPGWQDGYFLLGVACLRQGKYPDAAAALEQAVRMKPDDTFSLYSLGKAYHRMGKKTEAMQIYNRLAALDQPYAQQLLDFMKPAAKN